MSASAREDGRAAVGPVERELRWAALVLAPFLALASVLAAYGALQQAMGPFRVARLAGLLEILTWFGLTTAGPTAGVVALVMARTAWRGRGFASRADRLTFQALACLATSVLLVGACGPTDSGPFGGPGLVSGSLTLACAVFALTYWPRRFPSLSGLERRDEAAIPASPRS